MGLSVSYQAQGRNDPCPCGSGKKYKKCCYLKQNQGGYDPAEKERLLGRFNQIVENYPWYNKWFEQIIAPRLESAKSQELATREVMNMIMEAAYFEEKMRGKRMAELVVARLTKKDPDKVALTELVAKTRYEWLEIQGVVLGVKMATTSLWSGEEIVIYEQSGTYQARQGMLLATRLIPCLDGWQMTGHATYLPEQVGYKFRRAKKLGVDPPPLTQTEYVDSLIGYGQKETRESELAEEARAANAQIDPKLRPGPEETSLTTQMMAEASRLDLPPVKRVRDVALQEFCEEWLDKPQKELGNMNPRQRILQERKERGNPIKKIRYEVETRYGGDSRDELYNEGLWHQKEGKFWEAIGFYAQIVDYAPQLEESYRYYGNVAAGLAYLSCYEEANILLKKALAIEPSYEMAARNLASLSDRQILQSEMPRNIFYLWQVTKQKWTTLPLPHKPGLEQVGAGLMWYLKLVGAGEITLKPKSGELSIGAVRRIGDGLRIDAGLPIAPHILVVLGENLGLTRYNLTKRLVELTKKGKSWDQINPERWAEVVTTWLSTYMPTREKEGDNWINPVARVLPWLAAQPEKRRWELGELEDILKQVYKMKKEERVVNIHALILPELCAFGIVTIGEKIKYVEVSDYGRELLAAMSDEAKRQVPREIWKLLE